jgi:maltose O-acetyltransferase
MWPPGGLRDRVIARAYDKLRRMGENARYNKFRRQYDIATSFRFNGADAMLYGDGKIKCGPESYIGIGTTIQAAPGATVTIGRGCAISHGVRIYTENRDPDADIRSEKVIIADVTISDYVWIGVNVFIGQGVTIGEHAAVGANSVVTRDVEPWTIVRGIPAHVIRRKRGALSSRRA